MDQQPANPSHNISQPQPQLHHMYPLHVSQIPPRAATSTPVTSPGLFSPGNPRTTTMTFPPSSQSASEGTTPAAQSSPFLHPLQNRKVRETHVANVDRDFTTGRKIINHYEVIEEIGRGVHGKVKLARDLDNGQNVAIKIVPRFSKKRRLGRITQNVSPYEKTKREIAILKKIRHPNVVALLEVIDDPDYKKIYLCLEHVECGEVIWRKKGLPNICAFERRRIEREMRGEELTEDEEQYILELERRYNLREMKRAHTAEKTGAQGEYWSLELGQDDLENRWGPSEVDDDGEIAVGSLKSDSLSARNSAPTSQAPSRTQSVRSMAAVEHDVLSTATEDDIETPGPLRSNVSSSSVLAGAMYGAHEDVGSRERSPSMADSIISHMSSIDFNSQSHDPFADDFSYVPCFTIEEARSAFRDVILGLEYLHYQGIVHRDIKPANLLWTREHRVKISDFGVSYFGRPMRESEPDDTVSESEAQDFDDEFELSKTVGTPAFFAPELCYTDIDTGPPPKVSEQIDIWSLGVTLYCMIFARIPFLAEDEFQMFRKIAKEKVYIPTRRLRPVDPSTSPDTPWLYNRVNNPPFRDDHQLVYEDVDPDLRDLLEHMLIKDPRKRIAMRGVKQHPWVLKDLPNFIGWIDDTDPFRQSEGRKIQLTDKDLHDAVVPLTLLERARSTLKKTLGKLTQSRSMDRTEDHSRRRATSSAASSVGESPAHTPITLHLRDFRRKSLRGDGDYFTPAREHSHPQGEHPLTYSVTASPDESPSDDQPPLQLPAAVGGHPSHQVLEVATDFNTREEITDRQTPTPAQLKFHRYGHSQSISNAILNLQNTVLECRTEPATPATDVQLDDSSLLRKGRDITPSDDLTRSQSVDRAIVFSNPDKRAEAKVALSPFVAPGNVEQPKQLQQMRSINDLGKVLGESPLPSPRFFSPHAITAYQYGQHKSDPMLDKFRTVVKIEDRPMTAHRVQDIPEGKTPPPRVYGLSTPESFARAQEAQRRREKLAYEDELQRQELQPPAEIDPALVPCPSSPDDDDFMSRLAPSRGETFSTTFSSNSNSVDAIATPWTSPSVVTSPVSCTTSVSQKDFTNPGSEQILAFQSDPSLPALLSGASSVSADPEGEFLGVPGNPEVVNRTAVLESTDSVTPPALPKEPVTGFPLEEPYFDDHNEAAVRVDDHEPDAVAKPTPTPLATRDDDDDSDSDEGLLMMGHRSKRSYASKDTPGKLFFGSKRRNTNASVGSTDTAKKVFPPGE